MFHVVSSGRLLWPWPKKALRHALLRAELRLKQLREKAGKEKDGEPMLNHHVFRHFVSICRSWKIYHQNTYCLTVTFDFIRCDGCLLNGCCLESCWNRWLKHLDISWYPHDVEIIVCQIRRGEVWLPCCHPPQRYQSWHFWRVPREPPQLWKLLEILRNTVNSNSNSIQDYLTIFMIVYRKQLHGCVFEGWPIVCLSIPLLLRRRWDLVNSEDGWRNKASTCDFGTKKRAGLHIKKCLPRQHISEKKNFLLKQLDLQ